MLTVHHFRLLRYALAQIAVALSIATTPSFAAYGDLDQTFGGGAGKFLLPVGDSVDHVLAVSLQHDGKVVVSGYCYPTAASVVRLLCVARFLANGALDATFSNGGIFRGGAQDCRHGGSLITLPDSSVIVGGTQSDNVMGDRICAMKLDADGAIDASFGINGRAHVVVPLARSLNTTTKARALNDGKLLFAGSCNTNSGFPTFSNVRPSFCATRLLSDGTIDITYGVNGVFVARDDAVDAFLSDVVLDETGALFVGSCFLIPQKEQMCALRVTDAGSVDTSFGVQGRSVPNFNSHAKTSGLSGVRMIDGRYLLAGVCGDVTLYKGCLVRLDPVGGIDTSFGVDGAVLDSGSTPLSTFASIQPVSTSVFALGGRCGQSLVDNGLCAWKVNSDGAPITSFGMAGSVRVDFPPTTYAASGSGQFVVQRNQKLLLASSCVHPGGNEDYCLARLVGQSDYFDVDSNGDSLPATDGILYLRHLLGFRDAALTSGALSTYADRTAAADIATYLSTPNTTYPNCSASIVGAPSGPQAMIDGIVLLRAMMGLTGDAVTNGIAFPAGTARTSWVDIRAHLNGNCGMVLN